MSLTKLSLAGIFEFFPARESLVSDIPAGDGKIVNLLLQNLMQISTLSKILQKNFHKKKKLLA
jgi:hypothetical protein